MFDRALTAWQAQLAEERCRALIEDRVIREREHAKREQDHRASLSLLADQLRDLQRLHAGTTRDYLDARAKMLSEERKFREATVAQEAKLRQAEAEVKRASQRARKEAGQRADKAQEYATLFREHSINAQDQVEDLKAQLRDSQEQHDKRVGQLEAANRTLKHREQTAERRRRMDLEGFGYDLLAIREQVRAMQKLLVEMKLLCAAEEADRSELPSRFLLAERDLLGLQTSINNLETKLKLSSSA